MCGNVLFRVHTLRSEYLRVETCVVSYLRRKQVEKEMQNRAEAHRLLFQREWEKIEVEKKQLINLKKQPVATRPIRHQDMLTSSDDDPYPPIQPNVKV